MQLLFRSQNFLIIILLHSIQSHSSSFKAMGRCINLNLTKKATMFDLNLTAQASK